MILKDSTQSHNGLKRSLDSKNENNMRTKFPEDVFLQSKYTLIYQCQLSLGEVLNLSELIGLLSKSPQLSNNLYPGFMTKKSPRRPEVLDDISKQMQR